MTHLYESLQCDSMMSKEEKLHEQWNTNFESNIGSDRIIWVKVNWGQSGSNGVRRVTRLDLSQPHSEMILDLDTLLEE